MADVLILGYGNPLRGDDGLGWHAARILAATDAGDQVEVLSCHQLTPDLAEPASHAALVIFIDVSAQDPPGKISCREITLPGTAAPFAHALTPGTLLLWIQTLYGYTPQALLISMGGESFDLGESLSPVVAQSLPSLLACVRARIAGLEGEPDEKHQH